MGKKLISTRCQLDKPDEAIRHALKIVFKWSEKWELKSILDWYRIYVRCFLSWEKKLENPVHHRTGKPLKESTFKHYQREYEMCKRGYTARKLLIKLFVLNGVFGEPSATLRVKLQKYFETLKNETKDSFYTLEKLETHVGSLIQEHPERQEQPKFDEIFNLKKYTDLQIKYIESLSENMDLMHEIIKLKQELGILPPRALYFDDEEDEEKSSKGEFENRGLTIIDGGKKFEEQPPFAN